MARPGQLRSSMKPILGYPKATVDVEEASQGRWTAVPKREVEQHAGPQKTCQQIFGEALPLPPRADRHAVVLL